jgi:hypothetical protein
VSHFSPSASAHLLRKRTRADAAQSAVVTKGAQRTAACAPRIYRRRPAVRVWVRCDPRRACTCDVDNVPAGVTTSDAATTSAATHSAVHRRAIRSVLAPSQLTRQQASVCALPQHAQVDPAG